ncbi:serine/threonine-protein kinase STY8-like [Chenopodium quinoa]|uniref:serine/threonine-protein kinase STY8-like n=1 Tax=Chenopodium quinoa TaxID=63459 RepID=UPI000B77AD3B|nr:serine/threonine-protein kinase STY8-like [Chenopodium quinoa]
MDSPGAVRFPLGRQSSYAALDKLTTTTATSDDNNDDLRLPLIELTDGSSDGAAEPEGQDDGGEIEIPASVKLMFAAHEGDVDGIKELVEDSGADVNFKDMDNRTPLHVAACQGYVDVVDLLINMNAEVDPKDRWGSTPLADAIYYKNHEVVKALEDHGAKPPMAPMHVKNARDVPEYEIDPQEIDFSESVNINKGTFLRASWRGIQVAVKKLGDEVFTDEEKLRAFRDELSLLQRIRHPNVVQFLGAVTQHTPMMIVTEFLPKGDLCEFLKDKGALKPKTAVRFALDIARGMSYLHEIKPHPIIHCDLEPSNILRDDSGHLKVADFGVSKLLKVSKGVERNRPISCEDYSCRYMAPELFRNEDYDTKVDVFSFALILQEMIEGYPPFASKEDKNAQEAYAANERPPFKASGKSYPHKLKELIEVCWNEDPTKRPTFREIIARLDHIYSNLGRRKRWIKVRPLKCFQRNESSLGSSSYAM